MYEAKGTWHTAYLTRPLLDNLNNGGSNITLWHSSPHSLISPLIFLTPCTLLFNKECKLQSQWTEKHQRQSKLEQKRLEMLTLSHSHPHPSPSLLHSSHLYPYSFCLHLTLQYRFTITSYPPSPTHRLTTSHLKLSLLYPSSPFSTLLFYHNWILTIKPKFWLSCNNKSTSTRDIVAW